MTKVTKLERLNTPLFRSLAPNELAFVAAGAFTKLGRTQEGDGSVTNDYVED